MISSQETSMTQQVITYTVVLPDTSKATARLSGDVIDVTAIGGHLTVEAQALPAIIALLTTLNAAMVPTPVVEEPETEDGE